MWDVFAVSTYFTVSVVFWYIGLIPDLATLRDRSTNTYAKYIYAFLSLGWRGSAKHWHRYEQAYLLLAGLSTPLVLSVHSIVSFDFAVSVIPGWNVAVFPPYFVAGAVYAGFAMVMLLMIPVRKMYGLENIVTMKHFDWMAKITLCTGLVVAYGYALEVFYGWYSGTKIEASLLTWRMDLIHKPYSWLYWWLILCNVIIPQAFWSKRARQSWPWLIIVSISVNIGMWLERFVIIPMSLMNTYLPSSNRMYYPTIWDFSMFFGTVGFFTFMMFLFIRFLPAINVFEVKDLLHKLHHERRAKREEALATSGGQH
jgi:molybdopterin-containing oxidoreductase family membrane subunit